MEPQDSDKPRWGYGLEETPFSRYSYEQQKINTHKVKLLPALNIVFQLIIFLLSIWYYWNSILNTSLFLLINFILINIFFFILNLITIRNQFSTNRKKLYSCLIFLSTVVLLYVSIIVSPVENAVGILLLSWCIVILLDGIMYWLAKIIPPIIL